MMSDEVHPLPEDSAADQARSQSGPENAPGGQVPAAGGPRGDEGDSAGEAAPDSAERPAKRKILIGSQRDPAAYRAAPGMPLTPGKRRPAAAGESSGGKKSETGGENPAEPVPTSGGAPPAAEPAPAVEPPFAAEPAPEVMPPPGLRDVAADDLEEDDDEAAEEQARLNAEIQRLKAEVEESIGSFQPAGTPTISLKRQALSPDLQRELDEAMGDASLDSLIDETAERVKLGRLEADSRHLGRILAVHRENVFVELGSREQGIVPRKWFREPPEVGQPVEVRVVRYVPEEGLYELTLPAAAADVADWADISKDMLVEAKVTAANSGGLEVQVNRLRGFIPISQIDLFRVERPEDYVGQSFTCLVIEVNPQRKNLVLSRRAVLEREREQAQKALWDSLAPGQIRDGVIRKLMDFGAFVDIGGAEGLLHVSQMAWGRVKHPSELFREGQSIKVRIDKLDRDARKISLAYRDLMYNPWDEADKKYLPGSVWKGTVTRLMDFGAFVELEPGVEGLVHISELSLKRVNRVKDVVQEGGTVDVMVLSFDPESRRIGLSIKALLQKREAEAAANEAAESGGEPPPDAEPPKPAKKLKPVGPLKGGLGRSPGGAQFGLKL
ncbi:MAG: S1 RNA-binding domain-containing protein [Thermogutta sp.]|nr:S1 RNA-binding domain-containing protein [Thermogutta sp.]